jgi:hypothetical protein
MVGSKARSQDDRREPEALIPLTKAADLSGLSTSHLRLLVRQKKIWGVRMGRDWFTTEQAVREYLARDRKTGPKPLKGRSAKIN